MNIDPVSAANRSRGIGVLTLIGLAVMIVLFLLGIASWFFTSGTSNICLQVTGGDKAVLIARAAIAEVLAVIESSAKISDNRIYYYLRLPLTDDYTGDLTFDENLLVEPVEVRKMLKDDKSIRYIKVEAWIPWQLRLFRFLPYEKYGRLHIRGEVSIDPGAGFKKVVRSLEHVYEFKIAAPLPPKPFDSVTVFAGAMKNALVPYEGNYRQKQEEIDEWLADIEDDYNLDRGALGRLFQNNPPHNIYRAFPNYKYPPFPLNTRSGPGPLRSWDTDMDNPIFVREDPFHIKKLRLKWPEDLQQQAITVSYVSQGNTIRVWEGMDGTSSFQRGEVITVRTLGSASVSATLNNGEDSVSISQRQSFDSQGRPVNDIDITLRADTRPGYGNDTVTITGGGFAGCQVLFRGQQVHSLDTQTQDQMKRLETVIQTTLDDYGFTFRPLDEDFIEQFRTELAVQLTWDNYVTRATKKFDRAADFSRYIKVGGTWELDGIYLVQGPLTINAFYRGNGVIVTRGGTVSIERARADDPDEDTLTVISTDSDIALGGAASFDASLIAPQGTIRGLPGKTILGNVLVGYFETRLYNETPPGQVRYNRRLRRSRVGTGDIVFERFQFYINRHPLVTTVKREAW